MNKIIKHKSYGVSKFSNNDIENLLTIIITASFIPSHPSIRIIKQTIESLKKLNIGKSRIILAHDFSDDPKYQEYLDNLRDYVNDNYKENIIITVRKTWGNLTGNIRNAMKHVNTEYILMVQHDLKFIRQINIYKVIEDIKHLNFIKYVRFNRTTNKKWGFDAKNNLFGKQVKSNNYTYTRTSAWSDNNHLCRTDYYNNLVLKKCKDGTCMEWILHKESNEKNHDQFGTYIFDKINAKRYIYHTHGRIACKSLIYDIFFKLAIRIYKVIRFWQWIK